MNIPFIFFNPPEHVTGFRPGPPLIRSLMLFMTVAIFCMGCGRLTRDGARYANPLIEKYGSTPEVYEGSYGPDIVCEFILDFIEKNREQPFFVYYPMILPHRPFAPTPDSKEWSGEGYRVKGDTAFFKDYDRIYR
jgi:hypothetical protein